MTISNIDRAATIKSLATQADQVSREGLETYRQIGEHLNAEKAVQGHGKFVPWFDEQGFSFNIRTGQRMMKLDAKWDEIEQIKNDSGVVFDHTITGALTLLKPKPIQPADAERVLKLSQVSTERGSSESEAAMAESQIKKMADRYGTTPEKVVTQARKKVEKLELQKNIEEQEAQNEADLLSEIERLQAENEMLQTLLREHGITL